MEKKSFYQLGSLTSPPGAVCVAYGREGIIQYQAEIAKAAMKLTGIQITPDVEKIILSVCRKRLEEYDREVDTKGIPDKLKTLLEFTKKSKAVTYCKRIKLSEYELYLLVHNCSQIGFKHKLKFPEFIPPDINITKADIAEMEQGSPKKMATKIHRTIEERKVINIHLLERGKEWHCLYYTYRDMESGKKSHFSFGSHLHYLSHLWSPIRKRQVWESFNNRDFETSGVHIKLEPAVIDPRHINS